MGKGQLDLPEDHLQGRLHLMAREGGSQDRVTLQQKAPGLCERGHVQRTDQSPACDRNVDGPVVRIQAVEQDPVLQRCERVDILDISSSPHRGDRPVEVACGYPRPHSSTGNGVSSIHDRPCRAVVGARSMSGKSAAAKRPSACRQNAASSRSRSSAWSARRSMVAAS